MIQLESTALKFYLKDNNQIEFLLLDQTLLPEREEWIRIKDTAELVECIKSLRVRGAPLIGIAACLGLVQASMTAKNLIELQKAFQDLYQSRPTAVNLMNNLNEMSSLLTESWNTKLIVEKAVQIFRSDVDLCEKLSTHAASLIQDGDHLITHCNTGGLATAGLGTALGGIIRAHQQGKKIHVYVDETRPLLQGGRLTAWELMKHKIPMTLITDSMSAFVLKNKKIKGAFVGADRIAANGDFANKIGTYHLAIACHYHHVPFYVVAPKTTLDLNCKTGSDIHIEERASFEVAGARGSFGEVHWAPRNVQVFNPAFDVTPAELTTGWVIDSGILDFNMIQKGKLAEVGQ
jgi:methylthioribose-1-phosphate isomerase